jgi:CRP/FNR family transcriptional regulator, anaerobic regulatory protein
LPFLTTNLENTTSNIFNQLISKIQLVHKFTDQDIEMITGILHEQTIAKNDHFLKIGEISRHVAFLGTGLAMHYKLYDGMEIPVDFTPEGDWVAYLESFTNGTPADTGIKLLEDSQVLALSATNMQLLFQAQPKFASLKSFYTERSFMSNAQHSADLAMLSGKQRYHKFMNEKPHLINRIPQYYIAAYFGIKPQSLSQIRKET